MSLIADIAFARLTGLSLFLKKTLIDRFGSAEKIFALAETCAAESPEDGRAFELVRREADLKEAGKTEHTLRALGAWCVSYGSESYPRLLGEIEDPPLLLMGTGEMPPDDFRFLGMVGPRRPSNYGMRVARMLAEDLAREGLVLVSGMARGVDAAAHEACVKAGVPTVAVLGCGIDRTYPPEHALLRSGIEKVGAVVTEFVPGEPPRPAHFPQRNRIISGLCKAVLVVEAGEKSGARITARHALDQSREVYAVPGPIDSPLSAHTNRLISEGAKVVMSSAEILEDFFPGKVFRPTGGGSRERDLESLSPAARAVLGHLGPEEALGADELSVRGSFPVGAVLQSLLELELKGIVAKRADARYVRLKF